MQTSTDRNVQSHNESVKDVDLSTRDGDNHSPPVFVSGNIKIPSITLQYSEQQTRRYSRSLGQ